MGKMKPRLPSRAKIDKVLILISNLRDDSAVETACRRKPLSLTVAVARVAIVEARRRLTLAADYKRDEEVGSALLRLRTLYASAVRKKDPRTALSIQREISKLLGLYGRTDPQEALSALPAAQIAAICGVSRQTVARWVVRGAPRNEDGTYSLGGIVRWVTQLGYSLERLRPRDAVRLLDVTRPTLLAMVRRGAPRNEDGTYHGVALVRWRIEELEEGARQAAGELQTARTRRATLEAERAAIDLAERQGKLLYREHVLASLVARYQGVKTELVGLRGRLPGYGVNDGAAASITEDLRGILERFATGRVPLRLTEREAAVLEKLCRAGPELGPT